MSTRATNAGIDGTCASLTALMHERGLLHHDSRFVRTSAYGRTGVDVTGGPFYGTGASHLITSGTKGEVQQALWAIIRTFALADTTMGADQ